MTHPFFREFTFGVDQELPGGIALVDIHAKHKFSFWDSMILSAALQGGADLLYKEDLHGITIDGLTVKNPFE